VIKFDASRFRFARHRICILDVQQFSCNGRHPIGEPFCHQNFCVQAPTFPSLGKERPPANSIPVIPFRKLHFIPCIQFAGDRFSCLGLDLYRGSGLGIKLPFKS